MDTVVVIVVVTSVEKSVKDIVAVRVSSAASVVSNGETSVEASVVDAPTGEILPDGVVAAASSVDAGTSVDSIETRQGELGAFDFFPPWLE